MLIVELLFYFCIVSLILYSLRVLKIRHLLRKSDIVYSAIILCLILSQILIQFLPKIRTTIHSITYICIGLLLGLVLIYFLIRKIVSTQKFSDIHVWIVWTMYLIFGSGICFLLSKLPDTETDLYRIPFMLSLCLCMEYCPEAFGRKENKEENVDLSIENEDVEESDSKSAIEDHKSTVINLAIESWRLAKVFERTITQLNLDKPRRYTSQIEWFVKKAEESLEEVGLRIINLEGHPYESGMAVTAGNIDDFGSEDSLEVELMIEPIIMEGTVLVKAGKVSLRRK